MFLKLTVCRYATFCFCLLQVTILGNLAIDGLLNNISCKDVIPKIVLKTKDTVIEGPISFAETVIVAESLIIDEDLDTGLLFGLNTTTWLDNAIFVDSGLLNGSTYVF